MGNAVPKRSKRSKKHRSDNYRVEHKMCLEPAASENCNFSNETKKLLRERLDTDYGLLEDLRAVLTDEQYERIYPFKNIERNDKLLDIVNTLQYDRFMQGLKATSQSHLFNMIKERYGAVVEDEDCMPLTDEQRIVIETNMHHLVHVIDMRQFLPIVYGTGSITHPQYDFITVERISEVEKNKRMWEILLKKSQRDLEKVREAFEVTGQCSIASVLSRGGVIVAVRARINCKVGDQVGEQLELRFKEWNEVAGMDDCRQLSTELEKFCAGVELIAVKKLESGVEIYLNCMMKHSVRQLFQMNEKKMLKPLFDVIFFVILNRHNVEIQHSDIVETDYNRCMQHFRRIREIEQTKSQNGVGIRQKLDVSKQKPWSSLPKEVLEMLLTRASVLLFKTFTLKGTPDAAFEAAITLPRVCRRWWQVLSSKLFAKRRLHQTFDRLYCQSLRPLHLEKCLNLTETGGKKSHKSVCGVAVLNNELFVVSDGVPTVTVFDLSSFTVCQRISIDKLQCPTDIATCNVTHRIYIADCDGHSVWHLDWPGSQSAGTAIGHKFAMTDYLPWSLSVTRRQLLVTSYQSKSLYVYNSCGTCLQCIGPLTGKDSPSLLSPPLHAVQTTDQTYIVCHGSKEKQVQEQASATGLAEIVEYDVRGHQLRKNKIMDTSPELSCPCHMFLAIDNNYMLIADSSNHSILLFTSQLRFRGVVLSLEQQLDETQPRRLCYIQQTGQLFVGLSEGCVDVYNVSLY